jgi:hypothetical protein
MREKLESETMAMMAAMSPLSPQQQQQQHNEKSPREAAPTSSKPPSISTPSIHITTLNDELAIELLIDFGCVSSLHEKVTALGEVIDGECLKAIRSVKTLQILEGNHSEIRALKLEAVLEKVQQAVVAGISQETFNRIQSKWTDRKQQKPSNNSQPVTPIGTPFNQSKEEVQSVIQQDNQTHDCHSNVIAVKEEEAVKSPIIMEESKIEPIVVTGSSHSGKPLSTYLQFDFHNNVLA